MTVLLDANVLVAVKVAEHVHYEPARQWLAALAEPFASCPMTQAALVREVLRQGDPPETAVEMLRDLMGDRRHRFWPDDVGWSEVPLLGTAVPRQATAAYLAELARRHGGRLATFDGGVAATHPDVGTLIQTTPKL